MNTRLYVGNIPYSTVSSELENLFSQHGTVKEVKIIEGKGFAFVEMSSPEECSAAISALNGQDFNGRNLRVDEARPPKQRSGGRFGGDRGGSGRY